MKKKNVIILVLPFILVVLLISVSFAFFRSVTKIDKELVIGSLEIDYAEKNEINTSLKPIKEDEVLDKAYKLEFSISNINDVDIMSKIKLHINNISDNIKNDLKYKLYENDFELVDGDFTSSKTGEDLLLRDELYYEVGKTKNYVLYIYIEENNSNQNYVVDNNIDMKVIVEGKKITKTDMITAYSGYVNGDKRYFWIDEYRTNIKQIDFVDYINLDNAINLSNGTGANYWDMSADGDESVIAWLESNEEGTYHLYIGTNKDYIFVKGCYTYFYDLKNVEIINFGKVFRTDNVTNMSGMFWNCNNLKKMDLKYFDTSNVKDMGHIFRECRNLEYIDLTSFNTSNVTSMYCMFYYCISLKEVDLSKFDTSKVTDMGYMFINCKLISLDVSNFDTSKVTRMEGMFHFLSLENNYLDVSNFDTSNVTNMRRMFYSINIKYLDLSNFNTSKVTDMSEMFMYARLQYLNLNSFNTSNVTNMSEMFRGCNELKILDLSSFDVSSVIDKTDMFRDTSTSNIKKAYAKDEETATFFNNDTGKPSTYEFVVK